MAMGKTTPSTGSRDLIHRRQIKRVREADSRWALQGMDYVGRSQKSDMPPRAKKRISREPTFVELCVVSRAHAVSPTISDRAYVVHLAMTDGRSLQQSNNILDRTLPAHGDSRLLELRSYYREVPGTILTLAQACRLTGAGESRVQAALNGLIDEGFLRRIGVER